MKPKLPRRKVIDYSHKNRHTLKQLNNITSPLNVIQPRQGDSCEDALLSGVDLINSCNALFSCSGANGNEAFDELVDCCNDDPDQCKDEKRLGIVRAGGPDCVSCTCLITSHDIASSFVK